MKIYGIYNIKDNEICLRIGTLKEIANFLDLTSNEIDRALIKNNLIRCQYELCYLFNE